MRGSAHHDTPAPVAEQFYFLKKISTFAAVFTATYVVVFTLALGVWFMAAPPPCITATESGSTSHQAVCAMAALMAAVAVTVLSLGVFVWLAAQCLIVAILADFVVRVATHRCTARTQAVIRNLSLLVATVCVLFARINDMEDVTTNISHTCSSWYIHTKLVLNTWLE